MAWIDLTGLGRYHEKIKAWIEKNKYVHPANHPATMIVQDSLNQFVSKEQKDKWNNKLDADANAASASKLNKPVKINGIEFDGTKDIVINTGGSSSFFQELSYNSTLSKGTTNIKVPDEYWIFEGGSIYVFLNGIKLVPTKHFIIDYATKNIKINESYESDSEIEILFNSLDLSNKKYEAELEPSITEINVSGFLNFTEKTIIHVYVDGIKLIKDKHYKIDYVTKLITLNEPYSTKVNLEIIIM